ncbi:NUDIX hydrolase [bacterium]|nr:NUDIX hydrolase [bacterium]
MTTVSKTKFLEFKFAKTQAGHDWFYVKRTNDSSKHDSAVVITTLVKIKDEYNFLFLKTKRPPIYEENKAKYCIESPAGLIGDNDCEENLSECAKKELLEETGLVAETFYTELLNSSTSAGLSSETLSYVTAIVEDYKIIQEPVSDGGIIIERFFVPMKEIREFLRSNNNEDCSIASATVCGIFFALDRILI